MKDTVEKVEAAGMNHFSMVGDSTRSGRVFYAVMRNQVESDSIAMCKCETCGEDGIKPESKYCPNCGRRFV